MIVANDNPADALDDALDRRIAQLEQAGRIAGVQRLLAFENRSRSQNRLPVVDHGPSNMLVQQHLPRRF